MLGFFLGTPAAAVSPALLAPILVGAALLGAFGRRVAGGVLNQWFAPAGRVMGDLPARAIWGLSLGIAAIAGGATVWQALAVVPLVVAGCAVPMWAIDPLGDGYSSPRWLRCAGLAAHGLLSMLLVTAGAWWCGDGWWCLLAGSVAILPLYIAGWVIAPVQRSAFPAGLRLGSEIGEALWGCAMGVAVVLAVHGV